MYSYHRSWKSLWAPAVLVIGLALLVFGFPLAQRVTAGRPPNTLPPEKQAIEATYAHEQSTAFRAPKRPDEGTTVVKTQESEPARLAGLVDDSEAPFSPQDVTISNHWQQKLGGDWVRVYAGALTADPQQGVVIEVREPKDDSADVVTRHLTPAKVGALRITEAKGIVLRLAAADGSAFSFNAETQALTARGK